MIILIPYTPFTGSHSNVLASKLVNADPITTEESRIFLASMVESKNGKMIRFCNLQCIASNYFLTVHQCIHRMNERGGKEQVIITVETQTHKLSRDFEILTYQSFVDYIDESWGYKKDGSIPKYDVTLVWVSEIKCYDSSNIQGQLLYSN